ncbi:MAG: DEAD/DEAH box helicase family protein [Parcubacteria group bacterium]|jgi:type III restriction enzyme
MDYYKELKKYQEEAVEELILKSKMLLNKELTNRTIVFKSPTGSGKTFTISQYLGELVNELQGTDLCFLWLSPGEGNLHIQSYESLKKDTRGFVSVCLLEQEFFGSRKTIAPNEIVVGNWQKLSSKDSVTGEWKNILMKDKETTNFRELIANTRERGIKIILIIDESHSKSGAKRAFELRNEIIKPDLTIEMSATPILKEGEYNERVEVTPDRVIEEGMIKKEIVINENINKIDDDEITSRELIMEMAYRKRLELKEDYKKEGTDINPLVLIQIPVSDEGEDKKNFVESFLAKKGITYENKKLALWLSGKENKINQENWELIPNESGVEFLIFKQAIDTGWDCPRAQILVGFRKIESMIFELQTVGRIMRMPEAEHYLKDNLNRAYIYTNSNPKWIKFDGDEDWINKNIIKSIIVERNKIYKPLKLRSYYRKRIDFGDVTSSVYISLEKVFCDYFGIKIGKAEFNYAEKNKKLFEKKKVDISSLSGKEALVLNQQIDAKYFDYLDEKKIKYGDNFFAYLSDEDKERAFHNIIKHNIHNFAPKRSVPIVSMAIYRWFKNYLGFDMYNFGVIYTQNIILNNADVFSGLIDLAVDNYKPIKEKEKIKKIEENEEWNDEWEIIENRNYNPNVYKPFDKELALYKSPNDKKVYLNLDSVIEKDFVEFLEKNKDKILWWWQNGNEHMALNFGIKYGNGSTFQPDFLVMFKDGKIGIFDTKAVGYQEDDNKIKAEALQKYIAEENKKRKGALLTGGLVIKLGDHFRINSDSIYTSFEMPDKIRDEGVKYDAKNEKKVDWKILEF